MSHVAKRKAGLAENSPQQLIYSNNKKNPQQSSQIF